MTKRLSLPSLANEPAGSAPIPSSLDCLRDRDLAQRLATSVFGRELDPSVEPDPRASIEILEVLGLDTEDGVHELAHVEVVQSRFTGDETYSYRSLYCAHDLIFTLDDRFSDGEGNPIYSGLSSKQSIPCSGKKALSSLKRIEVINEYRESGKWTLPGSTYWDEVKLPALALELLKRFEAGEWLGLNTGNGSLYVQHLEELLGVDFSEANRIAVLLEDSEKITRNGNILSVGGKPLKRPSRLFACYSEDYGNKSTFEMNAYIPKNDLEPYDIRMEFYKDDHRGCRLYEVVQYHLLQPLKSDGSLSERDFLTMRRSVTNVMESMRRPYASPLLLEVQAIKELPEFEIFGESSNSEDRSSWPFGHGNLSVSDFGSWYCSYCGNQDDYLSPSEYDCIPHRSSEENLDRD